MNINTEIFRKLKPENKQHLVNSLSDNDLLNINKETIIRLIKEVGTGSGTRCHNKSMRLCSGVSNNWNAVVESISIYKKIPYISFYLQYDNTDTYEIGTIAEFLKNGDYVGFHEYEDRYGHTQTTPFTFNVNDKARVIKEILLTYIHDKYRI